MWALMDLIEIGLGLPPLIWAWLIGLPKKSALKVFLGLNPILPFKPIPLDNKDFFDAKFH